MRRSVSMFDKIALWLMLALCALLPFFFIPLGGVTPAESKNLLVAAILVPATLCLFAGYATAGIARAPFKALASAAIALPLLYVAYAFLAGTASPETRGDAILTAVLGSDALALAALVFAGRREAVLALSALLSGAVVFLTLNLLHLVVPAIPALPVSGEAVYVVSCLLAGIGIALAAERRALNIFTFLPKYHRGWSGYTVPAGVGAFVFFVALSGALSFRNNLADALIDRSQSVYHSSRDADRSQRLLQWALFLHGRDARARRETVALDMRRMRELAASLDVPEGGMLAQLKKMLEDAIGNGMAAVSSDEDDYRNWLSLAALYRFLAEGGVAGAYDNARAAYERALALRPNDPAIRDALAAMEAGRASLRAASSTSDTGATTAIPKKSKR